MYYLIPIFAALTTGTSINYFLTKIAGNKSANIWRSFAYALSKLILLFVVYYCFSFLERWIIIQLAGELLLFRYFFRPKLIGAIRFTFLSNMLGILSQIILAPSIEKFYSGFIY